MLVQLRDVGARARIKHRRIMNRKKEERERTEIKAKPYERKRKSKEDLFTCNSSALLACSTLNITYLDSAGFNSIEQTTYQQSN